jgi:hypothetical protein
MEENLINIETALASILVAAFVAYFAYRTVVRKQYVEAAEKFRESVLGQLKDIYPIATDWPDSMDCYLSNKFSALQNSVTTFEFALPWYKRYFFNRAWRIYRVGENGRDQDKQCYHQYLGFTIDDHYIDPRKQLNKNVDRLLKYAKT